MVMEIKKRASAGTMESSDAYVEIEPTAQGIEVQIESAVQTQFAGEIRRAVLSVLSEQDVENARIRVVDRGALDCVIRARVETAVLRGKGNV